MTPPEEKPKAPVFPVGTGDEFQIEITGTIAEEETYWNFMMPDEEEEEEKAEEEENTNKGPPIPNASSFFIFGPQNKFRSVAGFVVFPYFASLHCFCTLDC